MQLAATDNQGEIQAASDALRQAITAGAAKGIKDLGVKSGRFPAELYYHPQYDLWSAYLHLPNEKIPRHWFGFGLGDPTGLYHITPICETNVPITGTDRRVAAAFAKDMQGTIYLVHSGKIGGGRPGIGQSAFWNNYAGGTIDVVFPNHNIIEMAQIGGVFSKDIMSLLADFTKEVHRIKQLVVNGAIPAQSASQRNPDPHNHTPARGGFSNEFEGKRKSYMLPNPIEANSYHGRITNTLKDVLDTHGLSPKNDKLRDIYLCNATGAVETLFEVKTYCDTQSIYSGVGQLLLNASEHTKHKIFVVPDTTDRQKMNLASTYGINPLYFSFKGDNVYFYNINDIISLILTQE